LLPLGRRSDPPAWKRYGLEAGPEAVALSVGRSVDPAIGAPLNFYPVKSSFISPGPKDYLTGV